MYTSRPVCRVPQVCRRAAPSLTRNISFAPAPFFPRFPAGFSNGGELAPFFRVLDDFSSRAFDFPTRQTAPQVFQPRFDVEEVDGGYELRGELPGVDGQNLSVEFTDPTTLVIKGRSERATSSGTPPSTAAAAVEGASEEAAAVDNSDAESTHSTGSYVKATVEDDPAEPSTPGQATPAESTTAEQQQEQPANTTTTNATEQRQAEAPASRYWVSERSIGEFQRTFSFPARVDQDAVRASLKNGILQISVPKASTPASRRINIE